MTGPLTVSADALADQIGAIFRGWGVAPAPAASAVQAMVEADLMGIDSHGVTMLPTYEEFLNEGRLVLDPQIQIVRETPVTALVDGGGGLGHHVSSVAMDLAIEKAQRCGLAAVAVRHSNHYGAAGVYALRAARRGYIGISTSSVWKPAIVPTAAAEPLFGTNPLAFAAPTRRHEPFLLDMATSTVAIGKLKLAWLADKTLPQGWALDPDGRPVHDAAEALRHRLLTPLGGTPGMSSHKGYGLAAMVEVLSTVLAGATYAPLRAQADGHWDIGHFFLVLDPKCFRDEGSFEDDLDAMIDRLHGARAVDPDVPVQVAGDPEHRSRAARQVAGIPIAAPMVNLLAGIAQRAGVPFTLARLSD